MEEKSRLSGGEDVDIRVPPTSAEVVEEGFRRAPRTIMGLVGGGIVGALIGGPVGALIGGLCLGVLGAIADAEEVK